MVMDDDTSDFAGWLIGKLPVSLLGKLRRAYDLERGDKQFTQALGDLLEASIVLYGVEAAKGMTVAFGSPDHPIELKGDVNPITEEAVTALRKHLDKHGFEGLDSK